MRCSRSMPSRRASRSRSGLDRGRVGLEQAWMEVVDYWISTRSQKCSELKL